jgi:HlyD family secretion protein
MMARRQIQSEQMVASEAMSDRSDKLRSLSIPRERRKPATSGWGKPALVTVVALQSALLLYLLVPSGASSPVVTGNPVAVATAAEEAPATTPSRSGDGPVTVEASRTAGRLDAQGFVTASRVTTVSSRVLGVIKDVMVQAGDSVTEDQVLAKLVDADVQLELRLAEANRVAAQASLRSAQAQLQEAESDFQRKQSLHHRQFLSEAQLSAAQLALDTARANVERSQAELSVATLGAEQRRKLLDDHTIRAPFAGVVTARNAQPGEVLAPTGAGGGFTRTGICTIIDMNSLEIIVDVNEQKIQLVSENQEIEAELYAYPGWVVPGRVSQVMPNADRTRATVRVRIALLSNDRRILPDMGVRVRFL